MMIYPMQWPRLRPDGRLSPLGRFDRWANAVARSGIRLPTPRRTPFTFWYLIVLLGTTILLRSVRPQTAQRLLEWSSTNVLELSHHPLRVIVFSALWLPGLVWAPYALAYTLVLAPLERAVGARWTALMFLSGHLLATLATEVPVAIMLWLGRLGQQWETVLDVGVSYGVATTFGALLGLLVPRWRWLALIIAECWTLLVLGIEHDMTSVGHVIALNLGLLWWPWLARRKVLGSLRPWPFHRATDTGTSSERATEPAAA
jgi:Rhomboid-like protein